jgi:hypothetical protein
MSNLKRPKGRPRVYPIFEMEVGQSFVIEKETDVQRVRASISQMKRRHEARDKKFKILPVQNIEGQYLCSRIA